MFVTPQEAITLSMQTGMMLAEAQAVIAMRLWGMAGLWKVSPEESLRMVEEKAHVMAESAFSAGHAVLSGSGAAAVAMAALTPVRNRTSSNMQRLQKCGPGLPF